MLASFIFSVALVLLVQAEQLLLADESPLFPWIRNFASIGDSYAAGLGAGSRMDWLCSRYAQSYPNMLHTSLLGPNSARTHQFLACSGASSTEILDKQVPALGPDIDLLTISAGGNDIGLTPILSNCIYQFYMAEEDDCASAMQAARHLIADEAQLHRNITRLIDAARPHMNREHGVIYVTGYAGFFGADDNDCDNVTWAVWSTLESQKQYLKKDLRQALNALVRTVNAVLRKAVADADAAPNVRFLDYDAHIAQTRGRYCEAGVREPAPNRPGLAFYEWNTVDAGEDKTALQNRTGGDVPRGSFEGDIAERINQTLREHPDWEFDPEKGFVNKTMRGEGEGEGGGVDGQGIVGDTVHWLLPDAYKRVFHLRPEGQAVVARLLVGDLWVRGPGGGGGG
ncbi:SGNH hydrolase-type esterase domain-containing protein [Massariosphaeria phaeospora]|uniref:SGNH hydrolase-type esterase domain-containing protein n=1 Tax=Massariosphaeria phaeospora TaxID=100035 RepID=A0A7C8M2X5_9PLEO|nr:SGNH hydrolase-type esterase domain-containing protein [Massariosphaeria phaeospora]